MTVNYNLQLSNSKPWALFRILLRWHGSIWKLVLIELVIFLFLFLSINVFLNHILPENARGVAAEVTKWFKSQETFKMIPIEFMLGFFVQAIITRWQRMIYDIGFIDSLSLTVAGYVRGNTEYSRMIRRNAVRYICLAQVLASRDFSTAVRKRFPTIDSIVSAAVAKKQSILLSFNIVILWEDAKKLHLILTYIATLPLLVWSTFHSFIFGFMLPHEKLKFDQVDPELGSKYWLPVQWALSIIYSARQERIIENDFFCERICEEMRKFRNGLANLCKFDWVPLPLAYPQLVYLAVHVHFLITLISKQEVIPPKGQSNEMQMSSVAKELHRWIPLTPAVQFFFYMAWTKVAMVLINPFGEDDDDFETNALIDRNFKVGMRIADGVSDDVPMQMKDSFWDRRVEALYSEESAKTNEKTDGLVGSAARLGVPNNVQQVLMIPLKRASVVRTSSSNFASQLKRRFPRQSVMEDQSTVGSRRFSKPAKRGWISPSASLEREDHGTLGSPCVAYLSRHWSSCHGKTKPKMDASPHDIPRYENQAYAVEEPDGDRVLNHSSQQRQQQQQQQHRQQRITPDRPAINDDEEDCDDGYQQTAKM